MEEEIKKDKEEKEKNNKKRGFTLIELLAVIVILGLLLAIAIPSITKYIVESRKKTVVSSINGYMSSVVNSVNDQEYKFSTPNTIYAIPIECIPLEKGGVNPLGEWLQANNEYWAYVLVQYDSENFSYNYGFTFKDSAGYGMYPTVQSEIDPNSSDQIKTGLDLILPLNGKAKNIASIDKWNGFDIDSTTDLVVLVSESEGTPGDGENTCTLQQKGKNYATVEKEKLTRPQLLTKLIKKNNTLITAKPTLTTSSNNTSDVSGLYSSTDTNSGKETYYFRGNVTNNYVKFAGLTWKIIRINEDGTVRLILKDRIGTSGYAFNSVYDPYDKMYYSNSDSAKPTVDSWYQANIEDKGYDSYVSAGTFCEQAKVKLTNGYTSGDATMAVYTAYTPDFKCSTDGNGKGVINSKVGLITYDEVIHAGGYYGKSNSSYYLYNGSYSIWTMSPAGFRGDGKAFVWNIYSSGRVSDDGVMGTTLTLHPVINLTTDALAAGTGTSADPYVIKIS